MPKVGRVNLNFTGSTAVFELWYDQTRKFYLKGLPADFTQVMEEELPAGFDTEDDLRNTLLAMVETYKERTKQRRRVLMFKVTGSAKLTMHYNGDGSYTGRKKGVSERIARADFGSEDAEIGVTYKIADEITRGAGVKKYYPLKEDDTPGSPMNLGGQSGTGAWNVIDWTPEAEEFFSGIYQGMQQLLFKMSAFFSGDEHELAAKIASAGQLLLSTGQLFLPTSQNMEHEKQDA